MNQRVRAAARTVRTAAGRTDIDCAAEANVVAFIFSEYALMNVKLFAASEKLPWAAQMLLLPQFGC